MGLLEEDKIFDIDSNGSEESSHDEDEVVMKIVQHGENRKNNYSKINEELLNVIETRRTSDSLYYEDVGEDVHIKVSKYPEEDFGLTLICGEVFTPSWPAIIDIKRESPASKVNLKIGDQIKELQGIDTSTLLHWQLVGLFNRASDEITMTIRRGLDRSHSTFDWYKHPFSSVRPDFEELIIGDCKEKSSYPRGKCQGRCKCSNITASRANVGLKTFKADDDDDDLHVKIVNSQTRSFSQSSVIKKDLFKNSGKSRLDSYRKCLVKARDLVYPTNEANGIEQLYDNKGQLEVEGRSLSYSSSSMSSTMSDSTASSSTTYSDQTISNQQGNWLERISNPHDFNDDVFEDSLQKSSDSAKHTAKSTGLKITESFRRKKKKKSGSNKSEDIKYTIRRDEETENTLLLTVWIIDRRKLGLHLGGGSVSAYGDSNVKVIDVKKTGTGFGVFRVDDEILEISGVVTNGLNVYDVNRIISNLEGQYVEFKIFRPKCH